MRQLVPSGCVFLLAFASVAPGCGLSHERGTSELDAGVRDAAVAIDTPISLCDRDVGPIAPPGCVQGFGPICGDSLALAVCTAGGWQCPPGFVLESEAGCRCFGAPPPSCVCGEAGWECEPDAGCPADPASAVGRPCAVEGRSCGRCTDSCGFCNILRCEAGTWTRLEAHPRPPPCTSFGCGPELRCAAELEYCEHVLSDVGGVPDDFRCVALPDACHACECLAGGSPSCSQGVEGGLTVTLGGG